MSVCGWHQQPAGLEFNAGKIEKILGQLLNVQRLKMKKASRDWPHTFWCWSQFFWQEATWTTPTWSGSHGPRWTERAAQHGRLFCSGRYFRRLLVFQSRVKTSASVPDASRPIVEDVTLHGLRRVKTTQNRPRDTIGCFSATRLQIGRHSRRLMTALMRVCLCFFLIRKMHFQFYRLVLEKPVNK